MFLTISDPLNKNAAAIQMTIELVMYHIRLTPDYFLYGCTVSPLTSTVSTIAVK